MILTGQNIAHYLINRGLMSVASVVDGDFVVVDAPRRNQNFKVNRRKAPGFFVKQARDGSPDAVDSLRSEARCYELANDDPQFARLRALVPGMISFDPDNSVLVLELYAHAETLRERADRDRVFGCDVAQTLGSMLGAYHAMPASCFASARLCASFPPKKPWILGFHAQRFPAGVLNAGTAKLHSTLLAFPEYTGQLDYLAQDWQTDSLVHGDVKWDNCLVYPSADDGEMRLKMVDWELASIGDSSWDVGAVLQSYLTSWVLSMPDSGEPSASRLVDRAGFPLEGIQPAIASFWSSYTESRGVTAQQARPLLERSLRYGAARMVQTVYELAMYSAHLSPVASRVLQLSYNVLADPRGALEHLVAA